MNPIDVDEFINRKTLNNETYSYLKVGDQTEEAVDAEDILKEAHANPDHLDE